MGGGNFICKFANQGFCFLGKPRHQAERDSNLKNSRAAFSCPVIYGLHFITQPRNKQS